MKPPEFLGAALRGRYVFSIASGVAISVVVDVRIDLARAGGVLFGGRAFALRSFGVLLRGELGLFCAPSPGLSFLT